MAKKFKPFECVQFASRPCDPTFYVSRAWVRYFFDTNILIFYRLQVVLDVCPARYGRTDSTLIFFEITFQGCLKFKITRWQSSKQNRMVIYIDSTARGFSTADTLLTPITPTLSKLSNASQELLKGIYLYLFQLSSPKLCLTVPDPSAVLWR